MSLSSGREIIRANLLAARDGAMGGTGVSAGGTVGAEGAEGAEGAGVCLGDLNGVNGVEGDVTSWKKETVVWQASAQVTLDALSKAERARHLEHASFLEAFGRSLLTGAALSVSVATGEKRGEEGRRGEKRDEEG
jgi:hypothetical protein